MDFERAWQPKMDKKFFPEDEPRVANDSQSPSVENKSVLKPLKSSRSYANLKASGSRVRIGHWALVNYGLNDLRCVRFGFTVPRYVGSAVLRNKLKRWGREFFRGFKADLGSLDINVVFLKKTPEFYKSLTKIEFDTALGQALGKMVRAL